MTENIRLVVAMRRNHQTRHLSEFLTNFNQATDLNIAMSDIVEPSFSVHAERLLASTIQQKLSSGLLVRSCELLWPGILERINNSSEFFKGKPLLVLLCHFKDFMMWMRFVDFSNHVKQILRFDGDTVYAFTEDVEHGIGVDVYNSEVANEVRYTFDVW